MEIKSSSFLQVKTYKNVPLPIVLGLFLLILSCGQTRVRTESTHPKSAVPSNPAPTSNSSAGDPQQSPRPALNPTSTPTPPPKKIETPPKPGEKVGVILAAGGLRTFSYLGVLKSMEKLQIPIHSIVGLEWGALIAGLYAQQARTHDVEWKLFKLRKDHLPKSAVFGSSVKTGHISLLLDYLGEVFGSQKIENGKIPFACPSLSLEKGTVAWIKKGSAKDAVSFCLPYVPLFEPHRGFTAAPFEIENSAKLLRSAGMDVIIVINSNTKIPLSKNNSFDSGYAGQVLWTELRKNLFEKKSSVDWIVDVHLPEGDLMDYENLRSIVLSGQNTSLRVLEQIAQKYDF